MSCSQGQGSIQLKDSMQRNWRKVICFTSVYSLTQRRCDIGEKLQTGGWLGMGDTWFKG